MEAGSSAVELVASRQPVAVAVAVLLFHNAEKLLAKYSQSTGITLYTKQKKLQGAKGTKRQTLLLSESIKPSQEKKLFGISAKKINDRC